jgi:hypothetical protein
VLALGPGVRDALGREGTAQCNVWRGSQYGSSDWTPEGWYESQWVTGLSGRNWQTSTWAETEGRNWQGRNWQGRNWQGSSWNDQSDDQSYGTPIPGSGSYGVWG